MAPRSEKGGEKGSVSESRQFDIADELGCLDPEGHEEITRLRVRAYLRALAGGVLMARMKRHYSPQLDRDLISILYHEAKTRRIPMTRLANQLIRAALRFEGNLAAEDVLVFHITRTLPRGRSAEPLER